MTPPPPAALLPEPRTAAALPGAFPLRAAAIDAGSNALRFLAAEFRSPSEYEVLASERVPVRLGHGVFQTGQLDPKTMDDAADAFAFFRRRMDALGIVRYRAAATSAVRESRNGPAFVERIRKAADIRLEVIDGAEEMRLAHQAIASRIPMGDEPWIVCDLGGGSVEVALTNAEGIVWMESHTMGSVRLLEEFSGAGEDLARLHQLLTEYTSILRLHAESKQLRAAGFIATGGNMESLARLAGAAPDQRGVARVALADLRELILTLSRIPVRRRIKELGLREDRADVILPAAMVYERLCALAGAETILVPFVGVKEGLLLDLVDDWATHQAHEDKRDRQAVASALALGRRCMFEEAHGVHVANLSLSLFDQLTAEHGLDGEDRRVLHAAAILHDVGVFISHKKHHKHSFYIVSESELTGLSARETLMAANIARYHRKSEPSPRHEGFARLEEDERRRVTALSGILRVADALDREHLRNVASVRAVREKGRLRLVLEGRGGLLLERWALDKKKELFEKVFGLKIEAAQERTGA